MRKLSQEDFTEFYKKYRDWIESQEGQQDAYEYEKSFDGFIKDMGKELFKKTNEVETKASVRKKK